MKKAIFVLCLMLLSNFLLFSFVDTVRGGSYDNDFSSFDIGERNIDLDTDGVIFLNVTHDSYTNSGVRYRNINGAPTTEKTYSPRSIGGFFSLNSSGAYLVDLSFNIYANKAFLNSDMFRVYFYDENDDQVGYMIMSYNGGVPGVSYLIGSDSYSLNDGFNNSGNGNQEYTFNIVYDEDNDQLTMNLYNETDQTVPVTYTGDVSSYSPITWFSMLPVYGSGEATNDFYIDNVFMNNSKNLYGQQEQQEQICTSHWDTWWGEYTNHWGRSQYHMQYMEIEYKSKISGVIKSVDLYWEDDAWDNAGFDEDSITLTINSIPCGAIDDIIHIEPYVYILRWYVNVSGGNGKPIFEFEQIDEEAQTYGFYQLPSLIQYPPLDHYDCKVHSDDGFFGDGIFQGSGWGSYYTGSGYPYDEIEEFGSIPYFDFCYAEGDLYNPFANIPYTIWTNKYNYYLPNDNQVKIGYRTPTASGIIRLYKDSVEITDYGFPYYANKNEESILYNPISAGSYELKLFYGGSEEASTTFIVSGEDKDNFITSFPNPSPEGEQYVISWGYTGTNGRIYQGLSGDGSDANLYNIIPDSRSSNYGNLTVTPISTQPIYWFLVNFTNTSVYSFEDTHIHKTTTDNKKSDLYITITGDRLAENTVTALYNELGDQMRYIAEGNHPYAFSDVYLYANDELVTKVDTYFTYDLKDNYNLDTRFYNFSLRVNVNNTNTIVAYFRVTFADSSFWEYGDDEGSYDLQILVRSAFPDITVRVIIGLAIASVIMLLPFLISLKMKSKNITIQIPSTIYVAMFIVGVVASYILGFFPWEIAFLIAFVVVTVTIGAFLYGRKSDQGG